MNRLQLHIKGFENRIMKYPREWYHKVKSIKNKNLNPTIICNNCTAGFLLHDLSLQFCTPTINTLFFSFEEFVLFCNNLREIQILEPKEAKTSKTYPVGEIRLLTGEVIRIGFVHYKSFEEAKIAWIKRFKRVNLNNIYILYEGKIDEQQVESLSKINYPKSCLYKKNPMLESKYDFYHGFCFYDNWYPGIIGEYKKPFSLKRYLDEFDYISFLNK